MRTRSVVHSGFCRLTAFSFCALLCGLHGATAAEPRPQDPRKLEALLRRATDRIDQLLKDQKLSQDENTKLRDALTNLNDLLASEKKRAAEQLAAAEAEAVRAAKVLDAARKEAAANEAAARAQLARAKDEGEKLAKLAATQAEEIKKVRILAEQERARADELAAARAETAKALELAKTESARLATEGRALQQKLEREAAAGQAARDLAAAQRALAEKQAAAARDAVATALKDATQLTKDLADQRARAALAAAEQKAIQERSAQLEKRLVELEKDLQGGRKGADRIEGKITAVEKELVKINIGSDAGLTRGQVLDVYREAPKPILLGKATVVQVNAKDAVVKPIGTPKETLKAGDTVATGAEAPEKK